MEETGYTVGRMRPEWGKGGAQSLTFVVTEDCNLRCKYCYVTHKSKGKVLNLETAKKFIDYLLTSPDIHQSDSAVLDFIGGEPLLEAKLIEDICDYFKIRAYEEGSRCLTTELPCLHGNSVVIYSVYNNSCRGV